MRVPSSLISGLQSLSLVGVLGQAAVVGANPLPPKAARAVVADGVASLQDGSVKGFTDSNGNSVFLGIPFAATTGGQNRYVTPCCHVRLTRVY